MRLIYILLFFFICVNFNANGQSIFVELNAINFKKNQKYALVKFSDKEIASFSEEKKKRFSYQEGGVLFIPAPIKKKIQDTITFELEYNSDSTICTNKNIHSFPFDNILTIVPSVADRNCLSVDTIKENKVYQIKIKEVENNPINITTTNSLSCEDLKSEIEKEIIIQENTILIQAEFKWLSLNKWNPKGKVEVDGGLMNSAFKDEEGNYYILFEAGYYSEIRQVLCTSCKGRGPTVMDLQKEFLKRGYDVDLNNEIDFKTKTALTQFQKDNDLPVGNLNMETLRALLGDNY